MPISDVERDRAIGMLLAVNSFAKTTEHFVLIKQPRFTLTFMKIIEQ